MLIQLENHKHVITLIAIHIIVADSEIDNKEVEIIFNYNNDLNEIENEINKIYLDSKEKISLESLLEILADSPKVIIYEAFHLFLEVIYSDGYYDDSERNVLNKIRTKVFFDDSEFYILENEISNNLKLYNDKPESWSDNLRADFYSLISKLSINKDNSFKKKAKEILLNGPKFVQKIKDISDYATYDLKIVEEVIAESSNRISNLVTEINLHSESIKKIKRKDEKVNSFIDSLQQSVKEKSLENLKESTVVLNKKKKTINYFTISFLGRTKSGKSTLHSIITKEGDDAIGEGKTRTTRYNRVFNWENLRIIDTPGIGAPNGMSDVAIAESIVDESDLICYMVTNDAIQESEFKFLSEIKKKNKPVIVLLNVKENIENESRKNIFLKNPTKWKDRTDEKCLKGHIDRINEYLNKYYHNNYYRVIPVMLLSAKLSESENNVDLKKILYDASNIESFLTSLKDTVFENGFLRKSQNIIDGSNSRINIINEDFNEQYKLIKEINVRLVKEKTSFIKFLHENEGKFRNTLTGQISNSTLKMKIFANKFALNNYELNEKDVSNLWKKEFDKIGYKSQLDAKLKSEFENINDEIKIRLSETLESFQLFFHNISFDVKTKSTFNVKSLLNIGGASIGAIGAIAVFFGLITNPVGWIVAGAGVAIWLSNYLFESKKEKIVKAQKIIEDSLIKGIDELETNYKNIAIENLQKMLNEYEKSINTNMSQLITETEVLQKKINTERLFSNKKVNFLNIGMMTRTFQHMGYLPFEKNLEKSLQNNKSIISIKRSFQENKIELKTTLKIKPEDILKISNLLQSDFKTA